MRIGFDGRIIVYVNVSTYVGGMLLLFLLFVLLFGDYYRSLVPYGTMLLRS